MLRRMLLIVCIIQGLSLDIIHNRKAPSDQKYTFYLSKVKGFLKNNSLVDGKLNFTASNIK